MTVEILTGYAAATLSLLVAYVPGLNTWFEGLSGIYKRLVMLVLLFIVSLGALGIACTGNADVFGLTTICDYNGMVALARVFATAVIANQATFLITPKKH